MSGEIYVVTLHEWTENKKDEAVELLTLLVNANEARREATRHKELCEIEGNVDSYIIKEIVIRKYKGEEDLPEKVKEYIKDKKVIINDGNVKVKLEYIRYVKIDEQCKPLPEGYRESVEKDYEGKYIILK